MSLPRNLRTRPGRWLLVATTAALALTPTAVAAAAPTAPAAPAKACGPLDVALVIDDTGSMGGAITNLKTNVNAIVDDVVALSGSDYKLGLITFKDTVTVQTNLAAGTETAVKNYITSTLAAGGGGNTPEASDEAVNTAVNSLPAGPPRPQTGSFTGGWRSNATKLTVLITDAVPGGFDDTHTAADVTNAHNYALNAQSAGIKIGAIQVGTTAAVTPIMQDYATTTGGVYASTPNGADTSGIIRKMIGDCTPTDVFVRDHVSDTGVAPHGLNPIWTSPDIKVCNNSTGCANSENPGAGGTSWVFVTLNNPGPGGTGDSTGVLKVYYTALGGAAQWTGGGGDWNYIGEQAATVPAGTHTVKIKWAGVPGPGHFCLLARWVSATDPMTTPEGLNTFTNTRNNNNIAWRNVDSVKLAPGTKDIRDFTIRNPLRETLKTDLALTPVKDPFLGAGGRVIVDLGPELFKRWKESGGQAVGAKQVGETQLELVDPRAARLSGLVLNPGDSFPLRITFAAAAEAKLGVFPLQVNQLNGREDLGGAQFDIVVTKEVQG